MIYLAQPYTHADPAVMQARYEAGLDFMAQAVKAGDVVYSPIVQTHHLAGKGLPVNWDFWRKFDTHILRRCTEMWVLAMPGWGKSKGLQEEMRIASELDMKIIQITIYPNFETYYFNFKVPVTTDKCHNCREVFPSDLLGSFNGFDSKRLCLDCINEIALPHCFQKNKGCT